MLTVAKGERDTTFGDRLRELRAAAELTQAALAEKAGIQVNSVARLERGAYQPSWDVVRKLAAALGVEPNDFLPREE